MSCCTIKKETNSSIKEFDLLKKEFDVVELKNEDKYRVLTLKDKTGNAVIKDSVWLQLKIIYGSDSGRYNKTDNEILSSVCKDVLDWIKVLKDFDKSATQPKQMSLFEEDNTLENELEPLPENPTSDGKWGKYFNDCNRINKNNLMKQYGFFELFNDWNNAYLYKGIDYRPLLPTNDELIEMCKNAIISVSKTKKGYGRFDDYWWDDEYNWVTRDGALSDFEFMNRIKFQLRLYLVPYFEEKYISTDLSYSSFELGDKISHRFWFDGREMNHYGSFDNDKSKLPKYDINTPEFLEWCRNFFKVDYKEVISDDKILEENLNYYFKRIIGYDNDEFFIKEVINTSKDYKAFKSRFLSYCKSNNMEIGNGGGSGYSLDGFSGSIALDKKGCIEITQNLNLRLSLNRNINDLEVKGDDVIVFNIKGDDIYKKAFELMNKKTIKEVNLFDFLDAA